jgi:hypothetical protein
LRTPLPHPVLPGTGLAATLGRSLGYRGTWSLGLYASGLSSIQGATTSRRTTNAPRFNDEVYRSVTVAALVDLEGKRKQVTGELVGRLLFALDTPRSMFGEFVDFDTTYPYLNMGLFLMM